MKKNVIFVAIFAVLMICSCSKNKTATDSESGTSKIQFLRQLLIKNGVKFVIFL